MDKNYVMWFQYNGNMHLSKYDINRITEKYGTRKWRGKMYDRVKNWLKRRKERL